MKKRIYTLDTIRGIMIIGVVIYHIIFDLYDFFGLKSVSFICSPYADFVRDFGAGVLIFISGISSRLSKSNLKRGIKALFFAGILSAVTYAMDCFIFFGILHFLSVSMILYGVLEKIVEKMDSIFAVIVSLILFCGAWYVISNRLYPASFGNTVFGYIMGFSSGKYMSWDYFPIIPWGFLFLAGTFAGRYFRDGKIPKFMYNDYLKPVTFVGRYTIWIYLLHQPIVYGVLWLIFR